MRPRVQVLLSPGAEEARTRLPLRLRHEINAAIDRIARNPDWGQTAGSGEMPLPRFLNPGKSTPENSGLIADLSVQDGGLVYAIVYRIKDKGALIWVEDISALMLG